MNTAASLTRRELFSRLFRAGTSRAESKAASPRGEAGAGGRSLVAIIQGRFCLAYRNSFCTVCSERCPEPNAIVVENGLPRVVLDSCTGCGICHQVCPSPRNAVLMLPRKTSSTPSAL